MKSTCIWTLLWLGVTHLTQAQLASTGSMSLNAVEDSMRLNPKPVIILVSTEWCKYCRVQKKQLTKSNLSISEAGKPFYYSELDAEQKEDLKFNNTLYHYKSNGLSTGIHDLAVALAGNEDGITYPTWVILDSNYQKLLTYSGVWTSREINSVIEILQKPKR